MIQAHTGRALAALVLFAAPSLAQEQGSVQRIRALNEAAQAQRAVPEAARDETWEEEHGRTLYHLGVSLAAYEPEGGDRAYSQSRAQSVLEDLVFAAGEGTALALHAYVALGDLHAARDDWELAAAYYRSVATDLLGEPGSEPRRLEPVPEPRLEVREEREPAPVREPAEPEKPELPADEEVADEMAIEIGHGDALARRVESAGRVLETGGDADALAASAVELEAAIEAAAASPLRFRAQLLIGDLHAERDEWEEAAREYAAVVRSLTGVEAGSGLTADD